jgi:hypothetical protein
MKAFATDEKSPKPNPQSSQECPCAPACPCSPCTCGTSCRCGAVPASQH